jgi:RNA recognition motif-containing protein
MATKLYVGGLAYAVNDDQLKEFFASCGTVVSSQVIVDRDSNQSKGFGFVELSSEDEAQQAIKELNGKELEGRSIMVNEARPREERPRGSFNGSSNNNRRSQY